MSSYPSQQIEFSFALLLSLVACTEAETVSPLPLAPSVPSLIPATDLDAAPNRVEVSLVAREATVSFSDSSDTQVWGFADEASSGPLTVPGPLIEANVGDEVTVRLRNELPATTTIHFHGLRLDSTMDGAANHDDGVRPGESFAYRFIPRDAGVFWYHPHIRADEQIDRGLFGVLVVRDRPREVGERIFVIDDVELAEDGSIDIEPSIDDLMSGRQGDTVLVNGAVRPSLYVASGSRERWTFINASNGRHRRLHLDERAFDVVAGDVAALPRSYARDELLVVPGERWTVVVELAGAPQSVATLWTSAFDTGHASDASDEQVALVDLRFTAAEPVRIQPVTPASFEPLAVSEVPDRTLELTANFEKVEQPRYYINGEAWPFNEPLVAVARTAERWRIDNRAEAEHPFHLHGMFFQVLKADGEPDAELGWKDTVRVPPSSSVDLAVALEAGHWMFHCQIPEHAERGMMGEIHVEP